MKNSKPLKTIGMMIGAGVLALSLSTGAMAAKATAVNNYVIVFVDGKLKVFEGLNRVKIEMIMKVAGRDRTSKGRNWNTLGAGLSSAG